MRMVYSVLVKWPEQPIRQHLRLSFDELFTAICRTLSSSDSLESYGSERLSYLLGWPSLYIRLRTSSCSFYSSKKYTCLEYQKPNIKCLEPHFQISATRSGWKDISETVVALTYSRECTKETMSALPNNGSTQKFGARAKLPAENYGISYRKN